MKEFGRAATDVSRHQIQKNEMIIIFRNEIITIYQLMLSFCLKKVTGEVNKQDQLEI